MKIVVWWKKLRSSWSLVPAFCKHCGRDVHDFVAPEKEWKWVAQLGWGSVLCYDCFCEGCAQVGMLPVWKLEKLFGEEYR